MKLAALEMSALRIPFRRSFRHSSAVRSETESAWVVARSTRGHCGHGEGCPRSYVTGEDLASARAFFERQRASLLRDIHDLASLLGWMVEHEAEIDRAPAAWCGIELALLDLLGREQSCSVEALLGLPELSGTFTYSGVLGAGDLDGFHADLDRYLAFGLRDYKLKTCGELELDRSKLARLGAEHSVRRVRLDANNLWSSPEEAVAYLRALDAELFGVEEPLVPGPVTALASVADRTGARVILDESCTRGAHVDALPGDASRFVANLRVSKMGGVIRSLEVLKAARRRGVGVVVGAHVGETSLLTRAALTVASQARDLLVAQEGAYGPFLLRDDVCDPPLVFGRGGRLEAPRAAPGFGLRVR